MKKNGILLTALALLAMVGCENPEQSTLDFEEIGNKATISGVVTINKDGNQTSIVPMAGSSVRAEVNYSEYSSTSTGVKVFEATTNENGEYTLEIPVGTKAIAVTVQPQVLTVDGVWYTAPRSEVLTLTTGKKITTNFLLAADVDIAGEATVKGQVLYNAGYKKVGTEFVLENGYANGVSVVLTDADYVFETTTNAQGEYSLVVPVKKDGSTYTLTTREFEATYNDLIDGELFPLTVHYASTTQSVDVANKDVKTVSVMVNAYDVDDVTTRNQELKIEGLVTIANEIIPEDAVNLWTLKYNETDPAATKVIVTITNTNPDDDREVVYNTNLNKGTFSITAKLYDDWNLTNCKVEVEATPYVAEFTHYYKKWIASENDYASLWSTQKLNGIYQKASGKMTVADINVLLGVNFKLVMEYQAEDINNIYGITKKYDEQGNNLYESTNVGWNISTGVFSK